MPLFFVHIPKTAGTSFRLGAEQQFGKSRIVYVYGKQSPVTSSLAQETVYGKHPDYWDFLQSCNQEKIAMVGGHVDINRFVSLFGVQKTVTFLREPLQRMASEYAHFIRKFNYQGSFYDFYSRPEMHNRQSKALRKVEIETIGMLGITERYNESLELLNANYNTEITGREDNRGKVSLDAAHEISEEDEAELIRLNKQDVALYDRAVKMFDERYKLFKEAKPWVHARVTEANLGRIAGWAWWADSDEPVEVEILVNSELQASMPAAELRPGLCHLLPPRGGYVGFSLAVKLAPGDKVQCRVKSTGQCFPLKPRRIPKPEGVKQGRNK